MNVTNVTSENLIELEKSIFNLTNQYQNMTISLEMQINEI